MITRYLWAQIGWPLFWAAFFVRKGLHAVGTGLYWTLYYAVRERKYLFRLSFASMCIYRRLDGLCSGRRFTLENAYPTLGGGSTGPSITRYECASIVPAVVVANYVIIDWRRLDGLFGGRAIFSAKPFTSLSLGCTLP